LAKTIRELAIHGMPQRYLHTNIGYNSRLDSLQAAILNVKLIRLNKWINKRQEIANYYLSNLLVVENIKLPLSSLSNIGHSWNQFVIRILDSSFIKDHSDHYQDSEKRDLFKKELQNLGINTIIYYPIPIHLQPVYKKLGYKKGSLPITEEVCNQVISLPIFPELEFSQQSYVIDTIKRIYNK